MSFVDAATKLADENSYRSREYEIDGGPLDPISGGATALMGTATSIMMGVADMPVQTLKLLSIGSDAACSRKGKEKATNTDLDSIGESSRTGRPEVARTSTNTSDVSFMNGDSTSTVLQPPNVPGQPFGTSPNLTDTNISGTPGSPSHRSTFMSQAMAASSGHPRSSSKDRAVTLASSKFDVAGLPGRRKRADSSSGTDARSSNGSTSGFTANMKAALDAGNTETALDTGKGLARIVGAGFRSPMDFSLNIAQGFNNVPKLYGADVRPADKVTDFQSGIKAAAKAS